MIIIAPALGISILVTFIMEKCWKHSCAFIFDLIFADIERIRKRTKGYDHYLRNNFTLL